MVAAVEDGFDRDEVSETAGGVDGFTSAGLTVVLEVAAGVESSELSEELDSTLGERAFLAVAGVDVVALDCC